MFSRTTMELSRSIPTPRAIPPKDIMLSVRSAPYIRLKVAMTEMGIEKEMIMPKPEKEIEDKDGRLICPFWKIPISSLSHQFIEFDRWIWNPKSRHYEKQPTDRREQCICDHCKKPINNEACEILSTEDAISNHSNCKHTRIRFITEVVREIPEGYEEMQKRADVDLEKDYSTIGHYINKHICDECGELLFSDEP